MKKFYSIVLSAVVLLAMLMPLSLGVSAVSYDGSGTRTNPYLITNAEQLQAMRENLGAHFKLANTIDLKGVDFKPIGRLDAPFTGSFVCELNSDNTPKYIIKNLKQTIKKSAYASEKKNKWEGGLFGATNGATVTGIYVLDANVKNNNLGDNTGAVQYGNYKPGMDEMYTGILIGTATNTTVSNCGTSGSVGGSPSGCGGLIGGIDGGSVKNCYSTATVTTLGKWSVGGLIGSSKNANITSCYSTGNVKGGQTSVASFIGTAVSGSITDCYTTGNATGVKEDSTNFATIRECQGITITNCYTTGSIKKSILKNKEGKHTISNCYTLSGKKSDMTGFKSASKATIKSKIKGANWNSSGSTPTLKNIGVAKASSYKPGKSSAPKTNNGTTTPGTNGTTQTTSTPGSVTPGSTTTAPQGSVTGEQTTPAVSPEEVANMIKALPDPSAEGSITLDNKKAAMEAFNAYESLTDIQKEDFDANLAAKLTQVRYKVSLLLATDLVDRIKALPETDKLAGKDVDNILEMWDDYNFLSDEVKSEIDRKYVSKLEDAYKYASEAKKTGSTKVTVDETFSKWQWAIIIACGVLIILGIAFNIIAAVLYARKVKFYKYLNMDLDYVDEDDTDLSEQAEEDDEE